MLSEEKLRSIDMDKEKCIFEKLDTCVVNSKQKTAKLGYGFTEKRKPIWGRTIKFSSLSKAIKFMEEVQLYFDAKETADSDDNLLEGELL